MDMKLMVQTERILANLRILQKQAGSTPLIPVLEAFPEADWTVEKIHDACFELIAKMEVKNGWMLWPMRIALSGMQFTPGGGIEIAAILGKAETIARLKAGLAELS